MEILSSWNDWENLRYDGGLIGWGVQPALPVASSVQEATLEELQQIESIPDNIYLPIIINEQSPQKVHTS